jgi:hypothetical protein
MTGVVVGPNPYVASEVNSRTPHGERFVLLVKHLAPLPD